MTRAKPELSRRLKKLEIHSLSELKCKPMQLPANWYGRCNTLAPPSTEHATAAGDLEKVWKWKK